MKKSWMFVLATCVLFIAADFLPAVVATPYFQDDDDGISLEDEYSDNALDRLLQTAQNIKSLQSKRQEKSDDNDKIRACIRRGGNCDHRPNDCCYNSSCRCNLWGSNCRCQRMGLFQKWG
ncbi:Conotoxin [Popillia japonica]|uniref:Conotoxin n=1 Tax=Popillia japonica TaxID=7064 RepID=A0AAW1MZV9_POPJA